MGSSISNTVVAYICFRFQQDTIEVFRAEVHKLLMKILDNSNKLNNIRESLERIIRMLIAATELQDSMKILNLYHSISESLESAETKSQMMDAAVAGIVRILTETERERFSGPVVRGIEKYG